MWWCHMPVVNLYFFLNQNAGFFYETSQEAITLTKIEYFLDSIKNPEFNEIKTYKLN